jgi:hypothetical protein
MGFYGGAPGWEEAKYGALQRGVDKHGVLGRRFQTTFGIDMVL